MARLMLGTAQWGSTYGATNATGRLPDAEIAAVMTVAQGQGITCIDTAAGYGDAQERLRPWAPTMQITTKIASVGDAAAQARACCEALGVERVHCLLLHDWDASDAATRRTAVRALRSLMTDGVIERAGVSVYDEEGLRTAVTAFAEAGCALGAVQVPANVLDRRLDSSPLLAELHRSGAEIVVRSAFLQGLLLAPGGGRADHPHVAAFRNECSRTGADPLAVCLAHVRSLPWATHVVVGVTSAQELDQICQAWAAGVPSAADPLLASDDDDLIDPRRW